MSTKTVERLTVSSLATIYGCSGLFDLCGQDDLISLTMQGSSPFLDWVGWSGTEVCRVEYEFINWVRPDEGSERTGWLADPCADGNSVEFGVGAFRYDDFGRLRRHAPVQDITKDHLRLCDRQPRYRLDGTRIDNDMEFRSMLTAEAISQDLHTLAIDGNKSTGGQFDGFGQIVKTGYTDYTGKRIYLMDSIVIEWNHNSVSGGAGITWTDGRGARNVPANKNLVDVLREAWRIVRQRISWSPTLNAQQLRVGDVIILATTEMCEEIKDLFTYWSVYPGAQYYEAAFQTLEGREFRDSLDGGLFGDGAINLYGFTVPLLGYNWSLQKGPVTSDIYLLVRGVGNVRTLYGEFNSMIPVPRKDVEFMVTDGGRFLHWINNDHTCVEQYMEFQPRIIAFAPWTLVKIQNVTARRAGGFMSPDPLATSYFPESSFVIATS